MVTPSEKLPPQALTPTVPLPISAVVEQSPPEKMLSADVTSIIVTLAIGVGLGVLASISAHYFLPTSPRVLWLAVSVGGLGGLAHEIAQSGGRILFFQRRADGIYLGSVAGVILGAVAGLLAVKGLIVNPAAQPGSIQLIYEAFLAGLALKGITEAAGGQAVPLPPNPIAPSQTPATGGSTPAQPGQPNPTAPK